MARLTSIELSGWMSIERARIEFGSLNVLIGPNGGGKSNLIAFFDLLRLLPREQLGAFVSIMGGASTLLRYGPEVTRHINVSVLLAEELFSYEYRAQLDYAPLEAFSFTKEEIHRTTGQGDHGKLATGNPGSRESTVFNSRPDFELFPVFDLLQGCRTFHFQNTSPVSQLRRAVYVEDNLELRDNGANLAAVLYRLMHTERQAYKRVVSTVQQLFPQFGDFRLTPRAEDRTQIMLNWVEAGQDRVFGPHQLSDGTLRAMAIAALLEGPIDELPAVLVVDEPELGLHPYAIEVVAALLRKASHHCQVIVSTQSVQLLNHFDAEDVIVVNRDQTGASRYDRLSPDELAGWLEDYSLGELWDRNVFGGGPH
jgi:predicted ATPase